MNKARKTWESKEWKENRNKLIAEKEKCEECGSKENLTPAHPKKESYISFCISYYKGKKCEKCNHKSLYYRMRLKPHLMCNHCKISSKEDEEMIKEIINEEYISLIGCKLLCKSCHYKTHIDKEFYWKVFEKQDEINREMREKWEIKRIEKENKELNEEIERGGKELEEMYKEGSKEIPEFKPYWEKDNK